MAVVTATLKGTVEMKYVGPIIRVLAFEEDRHGHLRIVFALDGEVFRLYVGDAIETTLTTRMKAAS